ncbi:MAG: helix-turn-helix transcriptional regulator [Chloroflexota bacterium]
MLNRRIGRVHRTLRHRARLTQKALSAKCGVPRWKVGRLEADEIDALRFEEVERCLMALGAELEVRVRYRGAAADRMIDEAHARLVARIVEALRRLGWDSRVEVTFSEWGERGSYDILAWHSGTATLLVIEVKSEIATVEGTLRPIDIKLRLAPAVALKRFRWHARLVGQVLVLPEHRTARRAVERHAEVLRAALPSTSREIRAWLRNPESAIAGIWFISAPSGKDWSRSPSSVQRIRR